MALNSNPK